MVNDKAVGSVLLIGAFAGVALYFWLLFFVDALFILQLTVFILITGVLVIVGWIGYTMATTPSPEPIEFNDVS